MENKKKVAILGAGVMGTGIAQTFAMAGHEVKIIYVYDDKLRAKPMETMESNLRVLAENQALEESRIPEILGRVGLTEDLEEAAAFADIIFECIVENLAVKQDYFARLDALCGESTILATNTSAISVTEIAEKSVHKERIIGTHFWNPAYLVPLVEVIRTKYVSDEVVEETFALMEKAGKCRSSSRRTSLASLPTGCSTRCSERPSPSWNGESPLLRMWTKPSNTASACGLASARRWRSLTPAAQI